MYPITLSHSSTVLFCHTRNISLCITLAGQKCTTTQSATVALAAYVLSCSALRFCRRCRLFCSSSRSTIRTNASPPSSTDTQSSSLPSTSMRLSHTFTRTKPRLPSPDGGAVTGPGLSGHCCLLVSLSQHGPHALTAPPYSGHVEAAAHLQHDDVDAAVALDHIQHRVHPLQVPLLGRRRPQPAAVIEHSVCWVERGGPADSAARSKRRTRTASSTTRRRTSVWLVWWASRRRPSQWICVWMTVAAV